ncbi:MAG: 4-alpha-glucanotransferase [Elusimicrobiota bacterium]
MRKSPDPLHRRAGIALPLSGIRSEKDLGCGDLGSAVPFLDWMHRAGLSVLQLLPLNDLAPGDSCPYSSISAFALDPIYADLLRVPEIEDSPALRAALLRQTKTSSTRKLRGSRRVRFSKVRRLKMRWLKRAYTRLKSGGASTRRAKEFSSFRQRHRAWLEDYTLYRAIQNELGWVRWLRWPAGLRERDPKVLAAWRRRLSDGVGFYAYVQWALHEQWERLRRQAGLRGILISGDIPFGLSTGSADVWARRGDFDLSASMGAPPDRYSITGQAWGLPAYRWNRMESGGHQWWRRRIRRAGVFFDIFRIDHAVGFFRTWRTAAKGRKASFDIRGAAAQRARGRRFFRMTVQAGRPARPLAEDLGVIPPFVRKVLNELRIPGYKITRWERAGKGFRNPRRYPPLSVATTGNHDTSTIAAWWGEISRSERRRYWNSVVGLRGPAPRYSKKVHERLLGSAFAARSALAMLPVQDLFGTRERINVPGTVSQRNWTYRMPWEAESLAAGKSMSETTWMIRRLCALSGRLPTEHGGGTSSRYRSVGRLSS